MHDLGLRWVVVMVWTLKECCMGVPWYRHRKMWSTPCISSRTVTSITHTLTIYTGLLGVMLLDCLLSIPLYCQGDEIYTIQSIKRKNLFHKLYHCCLDNKIAIKSDKTNFVLFHMTNKPVPNDLGSIQTKNMKIRRVEIVNYLGHVIHENLHWNGDDNFVCASLVKYFVTFKHIKSFETSHIARQLYFAFNNSLINYAIELIANFTK